MKKYFILLLILSIASLDAKESLCHHIFSVGVEVGKLEASDSKEQLARIEKEISKIQKRINGQELKIEEYKSQFLNQEITEENFNSKIEKCEKKIKELNEVLISCNFLKSRLVVHYFEK